MQGVIHYNPRLQHQVDHARAFVSSGFEATTDPYENADIHIVSGPYYAKPYWLNHPKVLEIDRAWWGDPDCISIGWLQPDGTRKFASGTAPRAKPTMWDWKSNQWGDIGEIRCIVLADYQQNVSDIVEQASKRFASVTVRKHPTEEKALLPLVDDMQWADVVIGHSGTALFEAIKYGTPVICTDSSNECMPVCSEMGEDITYITTIDAIDKEYLTSYEPLFRGDREPWLHNMSYKQWSLAEIASGEAWDHLKDTQ